MTIKTPGFKVENTKAVRWELSRNYKMVEIGTLPE